MRARITTRFHRWSEGAVLSDFPEFRRVYGEAIADHIQKCAGMLEDLRDQPTGQDVRRTLKKIAKGEVVNWRFDEKTPKLMDRISKGKAVDVSRLDEKTSTFITAALYEKHWVVAGELSRMHQAIPFPVLELLPAEVLADCAAVALAEPKLRGGRKPTDDVAKVLSKGLLELAAELSSSQRRQLLLDALRSLGIGASEKNFGRVRTAIAG